MARREYTTLDGLQVGHGPRDSYNAEAAQVHTMGREHQIDMVLNAANSGDASTGTLSSKEAVIPAGSRIVSCVGVVGTTLVGPTVTTGIDVGLKDTVDGTAIDADGLLGTVTLTAGDVNTGAAELLLGTVTTEDSVVSIDVDSPVTAGDMQVIVRYVEPVPAQDSPAVITGLIGALAP